MMKISEATLVQRAGYLYRQLLLLQRVFRGADETNSVEWFTGSDDVDAPALCTAVQEVLDDLVEQARVLTTVPFPLKEWRVGDGPNDERWRALTEVERREIMSLLAAYETLITWADGQSLQPIDVPELHETMNAEVVMVRRRPLRDVNEVGDYLKAERARIARFRRDMAFLERRQIAESA
jgi:hypothetical protein